MAYDGWNLLGGFRLLGEALGILPDGVIDFSTVGVFGMGLENGLTLVL